MPSKQSCIDGFTNVDPIGLPRSHGPQVAGNQAAPCSRPKPGSFIFASNGVQQLMKCCRWLDLEFEARSPGEILASGRDGNVNCIKVGLKVSKMTHSGQKMAKREQL